jgi:hypothetical protein
MGTPARASFDEPGLCQILVCLRDRHVIDAELRGETTNWWQPRANRQLARCDTIDDLLMQLHEKRLAIAFR